MAEIHLEPAGAVPDSADDVHAGKGRPADGGGRVRQVGGCRWRAEVPAASDAPPSPARPSGIENKAMGMPEPENLAACFAAGETHVFEAVLGDVIVSHSRLPYEHDRRRRPRDEPGRPPGCALGATRGSASAPPGAMLPDGAKLRRSQLPARRHHGDRNNRPHRRIHHRHRPQPRRVRCPARHGHQGARILERLGGPAHVDGENPANSWCGSASRPAASTPATVSATSTCAATTSSTWAFTRRSPSRTAVEQIDDSPRVTGDLTIRGVIKPVSIDFEHVGGSRPVRPGRVWRGRP